jgi:tetrahydromethanopterin S-methyltransferase subunit G
MSKVDELKQLIDVDKYMDELNSRKDELEKELDDVKESLGEYVEEAKGWFKSNGKLIGMIAFALVIGFSLGAALV